VGSTFLIKNAHGGGYVRHLTADNNEIIAQSEGYQSKPGAQNGITAVKKDAPSAPSETVAADRESPVKLFTRRRSW
jgi:uncharacterized protein YegP (UPF0339 family)